LLRLGVKMRPVQGGGDLIGDGIQEFLINIFPSCRLTGSIADGQRAEWIAVQAQGDISHRVHQLGGIFIVIGQRQRGHVKDCLAGGDDAQREQGGIRDDNRLRHQGFDLLGLFLRNTGIHA
jgi:hypothetical protein